MPLVSERSRQSKKRAQARFFCDLNAVAPDNLFFEREAVLAALRFLNVLDILVSDFLGLNLELTND